MRSRDRHVGLSRRGAAGLATAAALSAGLASAPAASAEPCTVTVEVLGGAKLSFTVNVPPGTPLAALSLPIKLPVLSESETCASPAPTPPPAPPAAGSPAPPAASTTTTTSAAPRPAGSPKRQPSSAHRARPARPGRRLQSPSASPTLAAPATPVSRAGSPLRGDAGVPLVSNPTFSFALPGPAPLGVPDFFIEKFVIPPFLLPIYQAAGIQYDVPWQVLAAINEVETDYGRNLSVSSAGAIGWMQFLPATWRQYGVDANGDGVADPYNPVDAVFTAARYLHAAGASRSLAGAVFSYNHAGWYVQSVLLRAKLIGGMPDRLIGALTGLVQGHFPVAAASKYADDGVERIATRRVRGADPAVAIGSRGDRGVNIFARQGSPVIAVKDGKIVGLGYRRRLGRFVQLQDATGNVYTYAQLGQVPRFYAVPRPVRVSAVEISRQLAASPPPVPSGAASAGLQQLAPVKALKSLTGTVGRSVTLPTTSTPAPAPAAPAPPAPAPAAGVVKERLFAHPDRPASLAAGGEQQVLSETAQIASFRQYFTSTLHLARDQYTLAPLRKGAIVVAGTILGRLAAPGSRLSSHLRFMIQPAGKGAPLIDPKPILDGWKLLEATAIYRASNKNALVNPDPSIGQVLLMSKEQLQQRVLSDPHIKIYPCGRRDIAAGLIDQRILAALEYLTAQGLDPTIDRLACTPTNTPNTGTSASISQINGIPIQGHQGPGSITDITIRRLLTLQAALKPTQIISLMSYKGQTNTLALPDHTDQLQITYTPLYGQNKKLTHQITSALKPHQWIDLINRLGTLPEPVVPIQPSNYAIKTAG